MPLTSIYALINPINDSVFYIGASIRPYKRFASHLSGRNSYGCRYKNEIIKSIFASNRSPELLILEECNKEDAKNIEEWYIELFIFYGYDLRQMRKSSLPAEDISNREFFKIIYAKNKITCRMTIVRDGVSTDLSLEIRDVLNEEATKEFLRKEYRIKKISEAVKKLP